MRWPRPPANSRLVRGGAIKGAGSGCWLTFVRWKYGRERRPSVRRSRHDGSAPELPCDLALEGREDLVDIAGGRFLDHVLERCAPGVSKCAGQLVGPVETEHLGGSDLMRLLPNEQVRIRTRGNPLVGRDDRACRDPDRPRGRTRDVLQELP